MERQMFGGPAQGMGGSYPGIGMGGYPSQGMGYGGFPGQGMGYGGYPGQGMGYGGYPGQGMGYGGFPRQFLLTLVKRRVRIKHNFLNLIGFFQTENVVPSAKYKNCIKGYKMEKSQTTDNTGCGSLIISEKH